MTGRYCSQQVDAIYDRRDSFIRIYSRIDYDKRRRVGVSVPGEGYKSSHIVRTVTGHST